MYFEKYICFNVFSKILPTTFNEYKNNNWICISFVNCFWKNTIFQIEYIEFIYTNIKETVWNGSCLVDALEKGYLQMVWSH